MALFASRWTCSSSHLHSNCSTLSKTRFTGLPAETACLVARNFAGESTIAVVQAAGELFFTVLETHTVIKLFPAEGQKEVNEREGEKEEANFSVLEGSNALRALSETLHVKFIARQLALTPIRLALHLAVRRLLRPAESAAIDALVCVSVKCVWKSGRGRGRGRYIKERERDILRQLVYLAKGCGEETYHTDLNRSEMQLHTSRDRHLLHLHRNPIRMIQKQAGTIWERKNHDM